MLDSVKLFCERFLPYCSEIFNNKEFKLNRKAAYDVVLEKNSKKNMLMRFNNICKYLYIRI